MNREFHYRWEWRLRSSPQALWPSVADTNRFNMETGLPPVERADAGEPLALANARRRLKFTKLGLTVEWEEEPFEWVEPRCFGVVRRYSRGPVETMRVQADLTQLEDGGTRLVYQVWAEPRNLLGVMAIPIQIGIVSARSFANVFRQFDSQLSRGVLASGLNSRGGGTVKFTPGGRERLVAAHKGLRGEGVDTQLADQLIDLVEHADELAASQLRPYALADIWGLPRKSVLETFLVATRIGLLEFEWHLLCPLCRGARAKSASLAGIEPQVHCDTCNIDFEVNFDRAVELTFHPNPSIRHILMGEFCIAGPRVTPHVVLQQLLSAGECREVAIGLEGGRYRLRTLRLPGGRYLVASSGGAASIHLPMTDATWPGDEPTVALQSTLSLDNRTGEEQLLILERLAIADHNGTLIKTMGTRSWRFSDARLMQCRRCSRRNKRRPLPRMNWGSSTLRRGFTSAMRSL